MTDQILFHFFAGGAFGLSLGNQVGRPQRRSETTGRPKHQLFRRLTANAGYPKLREHLGAVVAIMELSHNWHDFMSKLDRLRPRYGDTMPLPLEYRDDDGKGL